MRKHWMNKHAGNFHLKIMDNLTSCVSFYKVDAFEREIKAKIIIFHHTAGGKRLQCYKTYDEINKHTIWLYLGDNHYHLIEKPTGFFGSAYVCNYCYETYEAVLSQSCKLRCNVCFTDVCHRPPIKTVKCHDCKRICRSKICLKQHKMEKIHEKIPCDRLKYYGACSSVYTVTKKGNAHKCRPLRCRHWIEHWWSALKSIISSSQTMKKKKTTDKYKVFDFETRYHNDSHEANFCCVKDFNS